MTDAAAPPTTARIASQRAELRDDAVFVATPEPRLSWTVETGEPGWRQASAEIRVGDDVARLARCQRRERPRQEHRLAGVEPHDVVAHSDLGGGLPPSRLAGLDRPAQARLGRRDEDGVVTELRAQGGDPGDRRGRCGIRHPLSPSYANRSTATVLRVAESPTSRVENTGPPTSRTT